MLFVGIAGMGLGCLDGMVIIGHRYSKSRFSVVLIMVEGTQKQLRRVSTMASLSACTSFH